MKNLLIGISVFACISFGLNIMLLLERFSSRNEKFQVLEVIDGDTFNIRTDRGTQRVRLIGVDTPEMGRCLSSDAKDALSSLVLGKNVSLKDQFSDPYGRIMANVFMDELYVNKELLVRGLGRMDYYENPHREELKVAYAEARTKKLGIFSDTCISRTPSTSSGGGSLCDIKGNVDDNTQKKVYFLARCNNYSQVTIDLSTEDQWFCSEKEAKQAGFLKSKTCL